MGKNNVLFNNKIIRRKATSVVFYGVLFLITIIAFYFVNISMAQDVISLTAHIMEEGSMEETTVELKASEADGKYTLKLSQELNGQTVEKYRIIPKKEIYGETSENENIIEQEGANEISQNTISENLLVETNNIIISESNIISETNAQNEEGNNDDEIIEVLPNEEIELTDEQIKEKEIYIIVVYAEKENQVENIQPQKIAPKAPYRAPSPTEEDSTLEIDDYTSDYYYYKGKNYTDNIAGTNSRNYTDSNLVRVTLNYHAFSKNQTNALMKGRVSLTERYDIIKNIRCLPIINGAVSIELMDNPFMDMPEDYGFGGWTTETGTINKDANTNAQTLSVTTSGDVTVDIYTNWIAAKVVYLNADSGNDNLNNGLTPETPFGSWQAASQYLYNNSNDRNDREQNIIVLVGNIDSSINYTKSATGTVQTITDITYTSTTTITSGEQYIIATGEGAGANAIRANGTSIANTTLSAYEEPQATTGWIITQVTGGYTIQNASTGRFLAYSTGWFSSGLTLQTNSFTWSYNNQRFYYRNSNTSYYYLRYNNGWTAQNSTSTGNYGTAIYLLKYTVGEPRQDTITTRPSSFSNNSYYSSSRSLAVTVTSLYGHVDYRNQATMSLTTTNYNSFTLYNDFQMHHVKINAQGYTSNSGGTTFDEDFPWLIGRLNNVRLGRGLECANNTSEGTIFANIIGDGRTTNSTTGSTTNSNNAYKIVVESGKYSSIIGNNYGSQSGTRPVNNYYGTVYLTLGNDIDRKNQENSTLSVYYRTTVIAGYGYLGRSNVDDKAFLINVKSGSYGEDFFTDNNGDSTTNSAYSGIYIGGFGYLNNGNTNYYDYSDRYCVVEGGEIVNLIGGLRARTNRAVETRIYVKGGDIYNIVGGAGNSTTYCDRIIQVTGGKIRYSISGGSNGYKGGSGDGNIDSCKTLVYIGGNAKIGTQPTTSTLYGVEAGCVLGAGNGNSTYANSGAGKVDSTHIIINDQAEISNSIYGGGNYGCVGSGTSATAVIDVLGGTIDKNIYGGSNQNSIYGSTTINMKGGQIKGAVYGGSNTTGTIATTTTINVTGGTLGTSGSQGQVLFGGGYGENTTVTGNSVVNILDTDANINMYGSAYGGSSLGKMSSNTTVNIHDDETNPNTINIVGNVFGGGRGDLNQNTITMIITGNSTVNVDGCNMPNANIFGGNDLKGTTNGNITVNIGQTKPSTVKNVYGGGNEDDTGTEADTVKVYLYQNANVTNAFNGGKSADLISTGASDTSRAIYLMGGTVTNVFGGSDTSGTVTSSHVYIQSGTATGVYGGNNEGGNTENSNVFVTGGTIQAVYGGGLEATTTTTNVKLSGGQIADAYGGGNGSGAVVSGNSTTIVEGATIIQNDLFGGGNAAANGTEISPNSLVRLYITGGTIGGDVYGAANTSVVYGETDVKIGMTAVNDNSLTKANIYIGGTVFGGGKSNTAGSANYDFDFESVTDDANILIDAYGYDNGTHTFTIGASVFGSGNAAKISGDGYVTIKNYGSSSNVKENVSIQRATKVVLDNCYMYLEGTSDSTNEIATAIYTFNRIEDLVLKNNTVLFLESGVNITSKFESLDNSNQKASVTIGQNGVTSRTANNKIYLSQGKNIILRTEEGTDGEVVGMTYVGLYKGGRARNVGFYSESYSDGQTISQELQEYFKRNSYVQGKHYISHDITVDGFYTHFDNEGTLDINYITPTPEDANYYQWIVGHATTDIYYEEIELIATKYATTATYVLPLTGLSAPNTTIEVKEFNTEELINTITLGNPNDIPSIAATAQDADSLFGLTMTAGSVGWQARGSTDFLTANNGSFTGTTTYISDNSTTTPTFSFYMGHSKNISTTQVLGTVMIKLQATYIENQEVKIRDAYITLRLATNNLINIDKDYYEGAITPGRQYSMFPTTTTAITKKSTFSAYYSLFINSYSQRPQFYPNYQGYYHVLITSCVLPQDTKITLIDTSGSRTRYYYYIVSAQDASNNKTRFRFDEFKAMDTRNEQYGADSSYYNTSQDLIFEEFIIQVDFKDTNLSTNLTSQNILIQLADSYDNTPRLTVNTAQYPMIFSVYKDIDTTKTVLLQTGTNIIYMGDTLNLSITNNYIFNQNEDQDTVYDTLHTDDKLGVRISISSGSNTLTAEQLAGIYIRYNNTNYFARSDGSFRIKLADVVSNVVANMELHTENGTLQTGTYTITAESFGSHDGTYFVEAIASDSKNIQVLNTNYGLSVELDNLSVLIDNITGKTKNNTNALNFTIGYSGAFSNPKLTVTLYRRKYDEVISYEYERVDLADYVENVLTQDTNEDEYLVTDNVQTTQNYSLTLSENLMTGTYKIRFTLYGNGMYIGDYSKTVIIK